MVHPRNRIFNNYGVLQNEDRIHMKAENENGTTQQCLGIQIGRRRRRGIQSLCLYRTDFLRQRI